MKKGKNPTVWLAMSMFLLLMVSTAAGGTIYADADAIGANNGSSWANHYDYLQDVPAAAGLIVQWQKTFGGSSSDTGYSVQQTSDGGYIIAGITYSYGAGRGDVYLIKTNSAGNMQWQRTFGGSSWDWALSVQQTTDAGYIVCGTTQSFGPGKSNIYLIKTDSTGNVEWEKTLRGRGYSVQQTSDGGYIIAGETRPFGPGDCYLIKTDSTGNVEWEKTFGGSSWDWAQSVEQTTDGGYILAGYTVSYGAGRSDVYVVKTDSAGNMQWQKTFGGSDYDHGWSVQQTTDGGYIITGYTDSYGPAYRDVYLIKTDSAGNMQWQKAFGGSNDELGFSVQQTTDDGYIIAGETESFGAGREDVYLIKTDSAGNMIWQKTFGGSDYDCGWSVQQTSDGGYIVAGETSSYGGGSDDVYLIKLGPPNTAPVACIVGGDRTIEATGLETRVTLDGSCSSDADSTPGTNDDIAHFDWYKVDACDPNFEDFLASGEIIDCNLPLGEHIIVLEVTDKAGAFDTNEVTIIVQDTTPPDFTLPVIPTTLWPANHKMVLITLSWTASDICDDSPEVTLVSITMNEGDETKGSGHTTDDIQIGDDGSIYLRAERSGTGSGRIYTITYQAADDSGNVAVASATVTVPHGQR